MRDCSAGVPNAVRHEPRLVGEARKARPAARRDTPKKFFKIPLVESLFFY